MLRVRERMWNECLHARDDHLRYALSTKRCISATEAKIIPGKVRIVLSQFVPPSRVKMPEASLLRWVLGRHWSNRTGYRNKIVVRGAQRREKFDGVGGRVGSEEKI